MPATMNIEAAKGRNASGPITKKRFVKLDTSASDGETVMQVDTAGELAYGVALFSVSNAEINRGKGCSVITDGRMILEASEAIPVGSPIGCEDDGRARIADSGDFILGMCDEPAAGAGDECSVMLSIGSGAKAA